jgi:UDP-glucose 4-epimerase
MLLRVLVTGAFGFLGRHVARAAAAAGLEVRGIGHGSWTRSEWRNWGLSDWHVADVTLEALASYGGEPDVIFHCAGSGAVAFSMTHPAQDFERSVLTTRDVLEYVRLYRQQAKVVLPSSAGVYGTVEVMPITVDSPLRPVSPYGLHKRMAEDLCCSYARHFGVGAAIVRLFSVYGPGLRKQLLWDACNRLSQGDAQFGGTGEETRDWIHVDDAAALMVQAARMASPACPIANGGAGAATIRSMVERIADRLGQGTAAHFSGLSRPGDPTHYQADRAEALAWGWHPRHDLSAGIDSYVDWFTVGAP